MSRSATTSMSSPSSPTPRPPAHRRADALVLELATAADGPDLAAIYRSDDGFDGDIAVQFTRDPDPYASLLAEGDDVVVPVARERPSPDHPRGRLVGMGACVTRTAWVNGAPARVGYLTGMKVLPEYRGRFRLIPRTYAMLREHTRHVDCYVTTILSTNSAARKLLEKQRPGMPAYRYVGDYTTHCLRLPRARGRDRVTAGTVEELVGLSYPSRPQLAPVGAPPAVTDDDVRVLRDGGGAALAWCAVVDQGATKQYRIMHYGGAYARLARLPVHWAGYPRLPRVGAAARYASIVSVGAADNDPRLVGELVRRVAVEFADRDFVMVGTTAGTPLAAALAGEHTLTYGSRLYDVVFDAGCQRLDGRPIRLDVALL